LVSPVPPLGLDEVGREDLAGLERDDGDLVLVDDGEDTRSGVGGGDPEMVETASPPEGDGAFAVSDVVPEPEVATLGSEACGQRLGCPPIRIAGRHPTDRPVGPQLVVGEPEGIELGLEPLEILRGRLPPQPAFEGLMEALDLALGLGMSRDPFFCRMPR
jgi:hypothetical protein